MTFGIEFKLPLTIVRGRLDLTGGLSGIYSETNGANGANSDTDFDGDRGRAELGLNYASENGTTLRVGTFYDGISSDYESYGVNFSLDMRF